MILVFPNSATLKLALTSGLVPEQVTAAPAEARFGDDGRIWVKPSVALDEAAKKELHKLGVKAGDVGDVSLDQSVLCWPQLLSLEREPGELTLGDRTAVLFELSSEAELADLAGEILRLGNDRQSFRWLTAAGDARALLRVVGPPYYSLLRALDATALASGARLNESADGGPVAYRESSPRVWRQVGYVHPLGDHLKPPAGKSLLLRPPRSWTFVEDRPFRDIYEVLEFTLPSPPTLWSDAEPSQRWKAPLRLSAASATDAAELWVLRGDALRHVDELVQGADDHLLARLVFAVGEKEQARTIVLRVRPSRQTPPVLVVPGVAFRSYLRLPNLFLPCGMRLHPPLRRDIVAKLLAADTKQVVWLYPETAGGFTPECVPENAFRPLQDWVDYILDREHRTLEGWVQATRFDFESFVCRDDQPAEKRPKKPPRSWAADEEEVVAEADAAAEAPAVEVINKSRRRKNQEAPKELVRVLPSEAEEELRALERRFLDFEGPLDLPARQALWPEMAQLNGALGHLDAGAICWTHALWEQDTPQSDWFEAWFRTEQPQAGETPAVVEIERILHEEHPSLSDLRTLVAGLAWSACTGRSHGVGKTGVRSPFAALVGPIQQYLQRHEMLLGVRMAWLAWTALHRVARGDVLMLARARDRLLERLYVGGLSPDLDLPGFLRFSGARASERFRLVRDHLANLRPLAKKWLLDGMLTVLGTEAYADLMFAYGLARLGEATESRKMVKEAPKKLPRRDEVHFWLLDAFEHRIQQVAEGRPGTDRLPVELLDRLERMDRLSRYKADRMREHSRILEPHEKIDPYRRWHGRFADQLTRELASLSDLTDRNELAARLQRLLGPKAKGGRGPDAEPRIVATALELAPRLGEEFADNILLRVQTVLDRLSAPLDEALLIEKGLFVAAHYDKNSQVQRLVARFHELLAGAGTGLPVHDLESLLGNAFRNLRKLGLRDEVGRLLERMTRLIERDPELRKAAAGAGAQATIAKSKAMRLLLQVASGWFYFGREDVGRGLVDEARALLFKGELMPVEQTSLACAYVTSLGQAPMELALPRLMELFRKLKGVYDTFTTHTHFSLSRLDLIEAVVLALVNEDFTVDPRVRRWLDDDEFLVRRRIHRDVRAALEGAGL